MMKPTIYIGVDPGKSGAVVCRLPSGDWCITKNDGTERDTSGAIGLIKLCAKGGSNCYATLERVSAMPKQGVSSTFKFGQSYGFLRGLLVAHSIPFETVTPAKWQRALGCLSKGDKNVTKAKAQELWPDVKWTHATADAALLAEYGRRKMEGLL